MCVSIPFGFCARPCIRCTLTTSSATPCRTDIYYPRLFLTYMDSPIFVFHATCPTGRHDRATACKTVDRMTRTHAADSKQLMWQMTPNPFATYSVCMCRMCLAAAQRCRLEVRGRLLTVRFSPSVLAIDLFSSAKRRVGPQVRRVPTSFRVVDP